MRILALDAASGRGNAGVVIDGALAGSPALAPDDAGLSNAIARLPLFVQSALGAACVDPLTLDLVAVTVGPGSFTGIRAALALAHGIAIGAGIAVIAVTVGEALAAALPHLGARALWVASDSRRGHVFLERDPGGPQALPAEAFPLAALPVSGRPVAVAGNAAPAVAAWLASANCDVMLTNARLPRPLHIAQVAFARHSGEIAPREARPLYVDAPEAKLPRGGLRPAPV
jgi:tRNA threonylcarbamoyl adenosine modification protein YeaZ